MDVTLLGTGSPIPLPDRGGSSLLVRIDDEPLLVDCGPMAVRRLLERGVDLAAVETLFFTHHHVDHNADFFQFVVGSWSVGRSALTIYGPAGTDAFVEALRDLYEEDIAYRKWFGYGSAGIDDIEVVRTTGDLSVETGSWTASALPVEHSIETYAYRFEDRATGQCCVVSGDTRRLDALAEFAAGADLLVQDACIAPVAADPPESAAVPARLTRPMSDEAVRKHERNHCTPADAGAIAADAGVDTLVLTHLLPARDHERMRDRAAAAFDGEVVVAEDGMTLHP